MTNLGALSSNALIPQDALAPPVRVGCKVFKTSSQIVIAGQKVSWDATGWDNSAPNAMWSAGDPTKLTVKTAGLYLFTFYGYWSGTAAGGNPDVRPYIYRDRPATGVGLVSSTHHPYLSTTAGYYMITTQIEGLVGDFFRAEVGINNVTYPYYAGGAAPDDQSRTTMIATRISA